MNIYKEIAQVLDAKFSPDNLEYHYKIHTDPNAAGFDRKTMLPKGMTKEQYGQKAEQVSLKKIDPITSGNRKVRAFKKRGADVINKTDGEWFVSYNNMHGKLNTAFPVNGYGYYESQLAHSEHEFLLDENEKWKDENNSNKKKNRRR